MVATKPHQATHLIVNNIERTGKLLKCINYCNFIVDLHWLLDSKLEKNFLSKYR